MPVIKYIGNTDDYTDPIMSAVWDKDQTRDVTQSQWQSLLDSGRFIDATPYQNPESNAKVVTNPVTGVIENFPTHVSSFMSGGVSFSAALRAAIAQQVAHASTREGRCGVIEIQSGEYDFDGVTINIPPFVRIRTIGPVRINATGSTVPVFWCRNDLPEYAFSQDIDSINNGVVLDARAGRLTIRGDRSAGGCALRVGNGDGAMGSAYAGPASHITALTEFHGVTSLLMDRAVELTNNSAFCMRFYNFRATSNNKGVVTSTGASVNMGETTTFFDGFFNNQKYSNLEANSAHQLGFINSSLTFCEQGNIEINADFSRLQFTGCRVENGPYVVKSNGAYTRSIVQFINTWLVPTWTGNAYPVTHLRKLFQGQHIAVLDSVVFDLNGSTPHSAGYADPAKYILADDAVTIHVGSIRANHEPSAAMKPQPIPHKNSNLIANGAFASDIAGWTKLSAGGTIAYSTAESYSAPGSLLATISAGQVRFESEHIPVEPGGYYYGDALIKALATPTIVGGIINFRVNWYKADNTTILSSSAYVAGGYGALAGGWARSAAGTGLVQAPAGSRYASIELATNAGTTMNFHIDDVYLVRLG